MFSCSRADDRISGDVSGDQTSLYQALTAFGEPWVFFELVFRERDHNLDAH